MTPPARNPATCPTCGAILTRHHTDGVGVFECPRTRCGRRTDAWEVDVRD